MTIDLRHEMASHWPFGSPDRRSRFEPHRVALEDANGKVLEELLQPRSSFKGHTALWSDLQLAYFAGYAMWAYLNIPFLLARPGVVSEKVEPWQEAGETWRRLKVRFPAGIATHSTEQTLYLDRQGFLRRQDYNVEIDSTAGAVSNGRYRYIRRYLVRFWYGRRAAGKTMAGCGCGSSSDDPAFSTLSALLQSDLIFAVVPVA